MRLESSNHALAPDHTREKSSSNKIRKAKPKGEPKNKHYLAANRVASAQNLLNRAREVLGHRAGAEGAGDRVHRLEVDRAGVLDVLLLLAVTLRLVEGLDDERGSRRNDFDLRLTVLHGQLNSHAETLEGLGTSGNIIGNLLSRL
jgi:hypothetical protein